MRLQFSRAASHEVDEAAVWYAQRANARVREAFRLELRRVLALVCAEPLLGTPGVAGTRRWSLRKFPYTVVYRLEGEVVRVQAVMHQRRHPGYWRGRA